MSKNIYSILNSSKNNTEEYEPISDMEVNNIMKRFRSENVSAKKSVNVKKIVCGFVAAAACAAAVAVVPAIRDSHKGNISISDSISANKGEASIGDSISANTDEASAADSSSVNKNSFLNNFFISASAAETEEEKEDGIMITQSNENGCIPFSGNYFFVHGNNIKTVSVSIDKGELYKANYRDVRNEHKDVLAYGEYIGREYTETFDKNRCYGFYFNEDMYYEYETSNDGNFKQAYHECVDELNGGVLNISVEYEDGTSDSASYTLKSGMIELDKETMKPNGNFSDGSTPYIYGVYFETN